MPKYWGKNYFAHGSFPEVGQKQKMERRKEEREKERLNDGNNNGQAMHGARKYAWRMQAAWANKKANHCQCPIMRTFLYMTQFLKKCSYHTNCLTRHTLSSPEIAR